MLSIVANIHSLSSHKPSWPLTTLIMTLHSKPYVLKPLVITSYQLKECMHYLILCRYIWNANTQYERRSSFIAQWMSSLWGWCFISRLFSSQACAMRLLLGNRCWTKAWCWQKRAAHSFCPELRDRHCGLSDEVKNGWFYTVHISVLKKTLFYIKEDSIFDDLGCIMYTIVQKLLK